MQSVSIGARRVDVTDPGIRRELTELGTGMCRVVGGHVLGCDVLAGADRLWSLETNSNPGFDADDTALADRFVAVV